MSVVNKLLEKVSEYIRVRGERLKMDIIAQISRLLAHFVAFLTIALIAFFLLSFLSIALAAYLNSVLDSPHFGYLIVAGIYLILLVGIIFLLRSNRIQNWLETLFISLSETPEIEEDEE